MKKFLHGWWPAMCWLIIVILLLVLPGSAFPQENWSAEIEFDKIIHIVLFAILVWTFCRGHYQTGKPRRVLKWLFVYITVMAILIGISLEFVQKYFVPNRSFDQGDIIADAIGAILGYVFSVWIYLGRRTN